MTGTNHGAHAHGDGDANENYREEVAAESVAATDRPADAATGAAITVAAGTVAAATRPAAASVGMSATASAGAMAATAPPTPASPIEVRRDPAAGPTAESAPRPAHDRWVVEDATTGPASESAPGASADVWVQRDPSDGPTALTSPGPAIGRGRAPIVSTVAPPSEQSERERIEDYLKTPFKTPAGERGTADEGEFGALMAMAAEAAEDHATVRDQMIYSRYVDTATGASLDAIGASVLVHRMRNPDGTLETDEHYRVRIKAQRRALMGGGRLIEIRRGVASLLGVAAGRIRVHENFPAEKAAFEVELTERMLRESDTPLKYVIEFVDLIRAGGVKANLTLRGEFRHRDKDAAPDKEHAYNYAPYTGDLRDVSPSDF